MLSDVLRLAESVKVLGTVVESVPISVMYDGAGW
jgi:hypothetical protein